MEYYILNTEEQVFTKNAEIYDMYATQPRSERTTLYCYPVFTNSEDFAMEYDGSYDADGLLDGLTPITEAEATAEGYNLEEPVIADSSIISKLLNDE